MSILEGSLAGEVAAALTDAGIPCDLTLSRPSPTATSPARDSWNPAAPTLTEYSCKGFIDEALAAIGSVDSATSTDVKIVVVASSLAVVPQPGDTITARGQPYIVISVAADPALATYVVSTRR